ncbi:hypothetical protein H3T61_05435 [Gilliamella sp. B14384H2]|uniref:hypothetical protein n=1 Tax=unclassified Gilliamella TaxID=2685620 RepID=UPI0018DE6A4A|nr:MULTISPECIES: hypothetical protein [unclassified Gilliamella]MBI0037667.1 hypothetical protein [Gilliamella sp. B14384G10]MBI0039662.1 hypothetical protein [Gilliamella sp. B14384G7]MBI0051502.1 hypothetical protein [Gilliamella sp. B14384G13]MBI0053954.1 hypothetical protein [Gilliamella sp. B14384H2]
MKTKIILVLVFFITVIQNAYGAAHYRTYVPRVRTYSFHTFHSSRGTGNETPLDNIFLSIFIIFFLGIFFLSAISVIQECKEAKDKLLAEEKEKRNELERIKLEEARAIKKAMDPKVEVYKLKKYRKKR